MDLGSVLHILLTAFVMIVMICVLVAAHEYGHYLFARLFGMGVEEFAIGFGRKPIWTWMRKTYSVEGVPGPAGRSAGVEFESSSFEYPTDGSAALQPEPAPDPSATPANVKLVTTETTDFTVRPWPLGGFVRIKGMVPEEDGSETKIPGGFYSKAPWKRFIVLLAGPVFSVLAGIIILIGLAVVSGKQVPAGTQLASVIKDGPAWKAGLREGDRIVSVNGSKTSSAYDVTVQVRDNAGKPLPVEYERNGKVLSTNITPELEATESIVVDKDWRATPEKRRQGKLKAIWVQKKVPVPLGEALREGAAIPGMVIGSMIDMIKQPSQIKENVGGPGSIAMATSQATKGGIESIIALAASLSISVGIFNLLPIFPLDGGQMLMAFLEMLRGGRRLSIKVQGAVSAVGMALVLMLFVSVIFIDVGRISDANKAEKPSPKVEKQTK